MDDRLPKLSPMVALAASMRSPSTGYRSMVDRSLWDSMAPSTALTNSFCRSGLAENCGNELFRACCCRVSLSSSRSLMWVTTLRTLESG
jgi:hypothetical protein